MEYRSAKEAAEQWGVHIRVAQGYCKAGRVPGAKKYGVSWMIPADAPKPLDPRKARKLPGEKPSAYSFFTTVPLPRCAPQAALNGVADVLRLLAAADLAFRRGDPEPAMALWRATQRGDEIKLSTASLATAAAISAGDYALYDEIQNSLQKQAEATADQRDKLLLSLPGVLATVSMAAPDMTPDWLKRCDFTLFSAELRPFLLFLHAMHLRNMGEHAAARAVAQATLTLCAQKQTFTWLDVYLNVLCAAASYALGEEAQSIRYLNEGLAMAMPYGMIAPFADYLGKLGGTLETLMKRCYPQYAKPTTALWDGAFKNWVRFHNAFAKDHITTLLTPREYQTAYLVARGETYTGAAKRMNLSASRVKHILADVYAKLYIQNKRELAAFIL